VVVFREGVILDVALIIRQRVRAQFSGRISIACYFYDARTPAHSSASITQQKYFHTPKLANLGADDAFFLSAVIVATM